MFTRDELTAIMGTKSIGEAQALIQLMAARHVADGGFPELHDMISALSDLAKALHANKNADVPGVFGTVFKAMVAQVRAVTEAVSMASGAADQE